MSASELGAAATTQGIMRRHRQCAIMRRLSLDPVLPGSAAIGIHAVRAILGDPDIGRVHPIAVHIGSDHDIMAGDTTADTGAAAAGRVPANG